MRYSHSAEWGSKGLETYDVRLTPPCRNSSAGLPLQVETREFFAVDWNLRIYRHFSVYPAGGGLRETPHPVPGISGTNDSYSLLLTQTRRCAGIYLHGSSADNRDGSAVTITHVRGAHFVPTRRAIGIYIYADRHTYMSFGGGSDKLATLLAVESFHASDGSSICSINNYLLLLYIMM